MSTEDVPTEPTVPAKKRPRIALDALTERKRGATAGGKSMFGLLVGTLNKAKIEDKERSASEAAKKRHLIEQRLQTKLRRETDSVRRAEEAKKDKMAANRKEEDLQLRDSIYKYRHTCLPLLAHFLLTSDSIPPPSDPPPPLAHPPRTHPPPLFYLPKILLPAQAAFLAQRSADAAAAAQTEHEHFRTERAAGVVEIDALRVRVAEEDARVRASRQANVEPEPEPEPEAEGEAKPEEAAEEEETPMDVDADRPEPEPLKEKVMEMEMDASEPPTAASAVPTAQDDDDAVEY